MICWLCCGSGEASSSGAIKKVSCPCCKGSGASSVSITSDDVALVQKRRYSKDGIRICNPAQNIGANLPISFVHYK